MKLSSAIVGAVLAALALGWFLGASGKSSIELQRRQEQQRADLAEAREAVLAGRVDLFQSNFGNAVKRFDAARLMLERVQLRLRETGQPDRAGQLEIVLAHLKDAGRLALALDANANAAADQALQALLR